MQICKSSELGAHAEMDFAAFTVPGSSQMINKPDHVYLHAALRFKNTQRNRLYSYLIKSQPLI